MSWPEVYKINSDFNSPLNHLIWLNDYKTYGQNSYVYQDKNKLHELYHDYYLSMNDNQIFGEALDFIIDENTEIGTAMSKVYGVNADLSEYATVSDIEGGFDITLYPSLLGKVVDYGSLSANELFNLLFNYSINDVIEINGGTFVVSSVSSDKKTMTIFYQGRIIGASERVNVPGANSAMADRTNPAFQVLSPKFRTITPNSLSTGTYNSYMALSNTNKTNLWNATKSTSSNGAWVGYFSSLSAYYYIKGANGSGDTGNDQSSYHGVMASYTVKY